MERLVELLKKYEKTIEKHDGFPIYNWKAENDGTIVAHDDFYGTRFKGGEAGLIICSKYYGFIDWLIEKDKIRWEDFSSYSLVNEGGIGLYLQLKTNEALYAFLAVQEWPLEFLLTILR